MLTIKAIENAKSTNKPYKLSDYGGLYVLIHPNGSKYWRYKYRFAGKENVFSIGIFDDVSLAEAREKRNEAKKLIANHIVPNEVKQNQKNDIIFAASNTFELIAREWHLKMADSWVPKHSNRILSLLVRTMFPYIGSIHLS